MMRILIATMATALAAMPLLAQGPREGRRAPGTDAIQQALNLTADQVALLQQYNQEMREAMRAALAEGKEKHEALQAELENESPNPTIVGQLVLDAHAAREQSTQLRAEFREKALAVLDAEQKSGLTALIDAEERTPALFEAGALNLVEGPRGGFGRGARRGHRGAGFTGGRVG